MRKHSQRRHGGHAYWGRTILAESLDLPETIYGLVDPAESGRVRYVGRTNNVVARYLNHCRSACSVALRAWVADLAAHGRLPVMVALEEGLRSSAVRAGGVSADEERWIAGLREIGQADLNVRTSSATRS